MGFKKPVHIAILICIMILMSTVSYGFSINARAAILMDPVTGRVLYSQNEHQKLPPASVTKVMTMLLVMEAIVAHRVNWDEIIITSATAAGMGGSQVYLKEGEEFTLRDMFKVIAIVSANDASTAVAEHLYGSIEDFIDAMNRKTKALGLKDTHFANETGLPDPEHYSSAYDLAVMSRELLKYPEVLKFTSIWLDTFRGGQFSLRNTNELIKAYRGADGLKTGHTDEAKFCLSGTAKKGNFRLVSVILGADTDAIRVHETKRLLDYGYRNYQFKVVKRANSDVGKVYIKEAQSKMVPVKVRSDFGAVVERGNDQFIRTELVPNQNIKLPIKIGQNIATINALINGKLVGSAKAYSIVKVQRANIIVLWWRSFLDFIQSLFRKKTK